MKPLAVRNFAPFLALLAMLGGFSAEAKVAKEAEFKETLVSPSETPKYLRINIAGYNIRKNSEFGTADQSNVDFRTTYGSVYAVKRMIRMQRGTAVNILVNGQDRWVYLPNFRKDEFKFCSSEACFSDLAEVLLLLEKQNISPSNLADCGIALNPDGSPYQHSLPLKASDMPVAQGPAPRSQAAAARLEQRLSPETRALSRTPISIKPGWERVRPDLGTKWTAQLIDSLDRHGKSLLNARSLQDAKTWCPNFSRLTTAQRKEFWVHLFSGLAEPESRYKPVSAFDESTHTNPRSGRVDPDNYSMGLLMVNYKTMREPSYRNFCKFNWAADKNKSVLDPSLSIYQTNRQMDCAVGIMNHLFSQNRMIGSSAGTDSEGNYIWKGGARFWSPFRHTNPAMALVKKSIRRFTPCGLR